MKTFNEWLEEMHMGRPHGQMGPDGRIYGHSTGPIAQIPGTNTWQSSRSNVQSPSKEEESLEEELWNSLNTQERLAYLSGHDFMSPQELQQSGLQNLQWNQLDDKAKYQINANQEFRWKIAGLAGKK
jgi:hypothetical protein